jgi:hypothetical protein
MTADKRQSLRRRTLKGAKAVLPNGGVIDCVVKDISEIGARIQIVDALSVPERFELRVPGTAPLHAEVVWRKLGFIGVRFET